MYISKYFFPLYVVSKICLSTVRLNFKTHLFSNVDIMTLNYILYLILVQNPGKCSFRMIIYIFPASTHND